MTPSLRSWRTWGLLVVIWSIPALAGTVDNYLYALRASDRSSIGFFRMAALEFPGWLVWVPLTPAILWLARRYRITWPPRARVIAIHTACLLVANVLHAATVAGITNLVRFPNFVEPPTRADFVFDIFDWVPITILTYAALVALSYAVELYTRYQHEQLRASALTAELANAQLAALRAQLQPHMMFNSLNTIASLIRTGDAPLAGRMVNGLGDILRHVLRASTTQEVPLSEELAFVERCIDIERIRFPDRVTVDMHVSDESRGALVPSMLLQPIVENAFKHGIMPLEGGGRIVLAAARDGDALVLTVRDSGRGFVSDPDGTESGVGLRNTRERLRQLYGERGTIRFATASEGGAQVTIRMPFVPAHRASVGLAHSTWRATVQAASAPFAGDTARDDA